MEVTVTDLCAKAGISRQSFYRRFEDKYAVGQWKWDRMFADVRANEATSADWRCAERAYLIAALTYFHDRISCNPLFNQSNDYNSTFNYACRRRTSDLLSLIEKRCGSPATEAQRRSISFFVNGEARAITAWMCEGMGVPIAQMAEEIVGNFPESLCKALDSAAAHHS